MPTILDQIIKLNDELWGTNPFVPDDKYVIKPTNSDTSYVRLPVCPRCDKLFNNMRGYHNHVKSHKSLDLK